MPQLQTVNLNPIPRTEPTNLERILSSAAQRETQDRAQAKDADILSRIYEQVERQGVDFEGQIRALSANPELSPTAKTNAIAHTLEAAKVNAELKKTLQKQMENEDKQVNNLRQTELIEDQRGLQRGTLASFASDPSLGERITRPEKEPKKTQASQPIDKDQLKRIQHVRQLPGYEESSPAKKYQMLTDSGVSKENAKAEADIYAEESKIGQTQRKEVSDSFKANEAYINKINDQFEDSMRRDAIFERMDQLEESGNLSGSRIINLLETVGLAPEWLANPANEEYNKLALDLLGGGTLQADYGSRVLASEFKVSQQRIPSLSQTAEGRKQIKENIRTMLLPAKLKEERMQYYIDKAERTGEPLPNNLRGRVLNDIKPQLEEAYDKFKQRNGRYKVKPGTYPDDNALEKYFYISGEDPEKAKKLMREDGYEF